LLVNLHIIKVFKPSEKLQMLIEKKAITLLINRYSLKVIV
jgi:hypothetical protein